jgi:hypothetical protein
MLVRFCILRRDPSSHSPKGVFQAAYELRDNDQLTNPEEEWLQREMSWLNMHLPVPGCLGISENDRAICWFKPDALRPIAKVRSIAALLEAKGVVVEMVTTDEPGSVIYEDRWQVVAKPHRKRRRGHR